MDVSGNLKKQITHYCFANLKLHLESKGSQMLDVPAVFNNYKYPLFVTWMKNGQLRGCIGTFSDQQSFGNTLQRYGLIAAVQDTRFQPISKAELPSLRVEISLLNTFEKIEDPLDWEVGKHGIEIEFKDPED